MFSTIWNTILEWLQALFFSQEMEITILGLQNAGKTTLVNLLSTGNFTQDRIPTVGFNMRRIQKGNVTLKCWDLGGQTRFRSMWERYCHGVDAIVFVFDSADHGKFELARKELTSILDKDALRGIPLLVLGNKRDLEGAEEEVGKLKEVMGLEKVKDREVCCYSVSAKSRFGIDETLKWLIAHGGKK